MVSRGSAVVLSRMPPHSYFVVSAIFHYLGPALAVLLFAHVAPTGVAWLRIGHAWRYERERASREMKVRAAISAATQPSEPMLTCPDLTLCSRQ